MPLLVVCAVTTQAMRIHVLFRHCLEADDLGDVPSPRYVRRARTMTGLAAMPVVQSGFEMGSAFEFVLVKVFVTGFANVTTNVRCRLVLRWYDVLFLPDGGRWPNPQQQQGCSDSRYQPPCNYFSRLHSQTPYSQREHPFATPHGGSGRCFLGQLI
jgi:hypothetical protein